MAHNTKLPSTRRSSVQIGPSALVDPRQYVLIKRNMKPKDVRERVSQTEKVRCDFVIAEIETARTFARIAQTLYRVGSKEHAESATEMAWKAFRGATARLPELGMGEAARRELSDRLNQIRETLEALPPGPRVVRKDGEHR